MNTELNTVTRRSRGHWLNGKLDQAKKSIRRRLVAEFQHIVPLAVVRRTVDEAEQLAHRTGFPHLVFPLLAEEMVERVSMLPGEMPAGLALVAA